MSTKQQRDDLLTLADALEMDSDDARVDDDEMDADPHEQRVYRDGEPIARAPQHSDDASTDDEDGPDSEANASENGSSYSEGGHATTGGSSASDSSSEASNVGSFLSPRLSVIVGSLKAGRAQKKRSGMSPEERHHKYMDTQRKPPHDRPSTARVWPEDVVRQFL